MTPRCSNSTSDVITSINVSTGAPRRAASAAEVPYYDEAIIIPNGDLIIRGRLRRQRRHHSLGSRGVYQLLSGHRLIIRIQERVQRRRDGVRAAAELRARLEALHPVLVVIDIGTGDESQIPLVTKISEYFHQSKIL